MKPIKIAVIGAGKMSQKIHLPVLKRLRDEGFYELCLLGDIDDSKASSAAALFGFRNHTPYAEEIFGDSGIDAVFVLGTAQMHYEYALKSLRCGKHVFIEKPPAPDSECLEKIIACQRSSGKIAAVGFNRRFQNNVAFIKSHTQGYSKIRSMEAVFHKPAFEQAAPYGAKTWLGANGIHALDTLCFLAGKPPVYLNCAHPPVKTESPEQNFSAILRWENGTHAVFSSNNSAGARQEAYAVHGAGFSFICDGLNLVECSGSHELKKEYSDWIEHGGFYAEHLEFANAILESRKPVHAVETGRFALRLAERIEEAYNGPLEWPDVLPQPMAIQETYEENKRLLFVLNPSGIAALLPKITPRYHLVYPESFPTLTPAQKENIVGILTGRGGGALDPRWLEELPSLKVVGIVGASVKRFNAEACVEKGIPVINASDAYAETVAEFVLMQAILGVRRALVSHEAIRSGGWGYQKAFLQGSNKSVWDFLKEKFRKPVKKTKGPRKAGNRQGPSELNFKGCSVGIVGYGAVSRKLIEYLTPFECRVKVFSEFLSDEEALGLGVSKTDLAGALACRVVTLHRGLSERTRGSIGQREIRGLKPGTVFINTARAGLVDEKALLERLKKGDIFACLDVFSLEPLPPDHGLRKLPNVFLTAHISGSTAEMYENASAGLVDKLMRYLDGEAVPELIDSVEQISNMT